MAVARRLLAVLLAMAAAVTTEARSGLLMPACTWRTPSGDCADDDGSSMLQTQGGIKKLKEPAEDELLLEEDEEDEEGKEALAEGEKAQAAATGK
eukprot:CAMPEP_0171192192 /NCGR_PEP_ID=MMETSP0790-20130122/19747_1 /TAXON_ID=2925 /ORGANISM="Alexandrium catenella, Strain OF101" /LENGTH=94 /DNA_ID=CAMNT_0011657351 /DNA_START=72 /DNA_END=356 /DNA_ORIENTATION=-